jgi:hypothetical protein
VAHLNSATLPVDGKENWNTYTGETPVTPKTRPTVAALHQIMTDLVDSTIVTPTLF